jgi:hypothetical protein
MTGAEQPPLLGRGLRGPPAPTGRQRQPGHLTSRQVVPAGAKVQVYPAALPLHLIDLALAVVVAAGLEREQLGVARKRLECCQHVPYSHALSVATWAL